MSNEMPTKEKLAVLTATSVCLGLLAFVALILLWASAEPVMAKDDGKTLWVGAGGGCQKFTNIAKVVRSTGVGEFEAYNTENKKVVTMGSNNWYLMED